MNNFFQNTPNIIAEAAKSPLGIFALMIIALSILAFFFFRASSDKIRASIFFLMFIGVVSFGAATLHSVPSTTPVAVSPPTHETAPPKQEPNDKKHIPETSKPVHDIPEKSQPNPPQNLPTSHEVVTDLWVFQIIDIQEMSSYRTHYSAEESNVNTHAKNDKLLIVEVRLKNRTERIQSIHTNNWSRIAFTITDKEGLIYPEWSFDGRPGRQQIAPGGTVKFALISNLPKEAIPVSLACIIVDDNGTSKIETLLTGK